MLLHDSLKFKQHPCFQSSCFENYQLTFTSGGVTVHVAVVYWSHQTKKSGPGNFQSFQLSSTLKSASLIQHVHECTDRHGHIFDLVISCDIHDV